MWEDSAKLLWMAGLFLVWAFATLMLWQSKDVLLGLLRRGKKEHEKEASKPVNPLYAPVSNKTLMEAAARTVEKFGIGTRLKAQSEHPLRFSIESIVVGYRIDSTYVFAPNEIRINRSDEVPILEVRGEDGFESITHIKHFQLLIPDPTKDAELMDYDIRAEMSDSRMLAPSSRLLLSSLGAGSHELRIEAVTRSSLVIHEGPHPGLQITLLQILLDTLEDFEPRTQSRVLTKDTVVQCRKNGRGEAMDCALMDISESALRLQERDEKQHWPSFDGRDYAIISLNVDNIQLRCRCIREQGDQRIFKIEQIAKNGEFKPFGIVDGLELKMHFMYQNANEEERSSS